MKKVDFLVIYARSLAPKMASLVENFSERDWAFSIITETWFVDCPVCEDVQATLKNGHAIDSSATTGHRKWADPRVVVWRCDSNVIKLF